MWWWVGLRVGGLEGELDLHYKDVLRGMLDLSYCL